MELSVAAGVVTLGHLALHGCSAPASKDSGASMAATTPASESNAATLAYLPTADDGLAGVEFFALDTVCTIKAYATNGLLESLYERCVYFEQHLSRHLEDSDVSRINAANGKPVEVAAETADVIAQALLYSEESGGLFDITVGTALELWDFRKGIVPNAEELAEAVKHIGWQGVTVKGNTVTLLDPKTKIDLGGIAKGYIADDLARMLREAGCEGALVNLGGNVYALGAKANGSEWNIGLQDPNDERGAIIGKMKARDASVVTSGLYERNFEHDGVLYYHILDPLTGYPAKTDIVSVSVYSKKSVDGDAYATTLFLMGADKALKLLGSKDALEGLVVDETGAIHPSTGFEWERLDAPEGGKE